MLTRFLQWHAAGGRELIGAELTVDVPLGRVQIRGKVDRLERDSAGRLVVVDLKTGKTPARDVEEHGQLAAYQVAVAAGAFAQHGSVPGGAALVQLGSGVKAKEQAQEPLPDDVPMPDTWAGELIADVGDGHGRGHLRGAHRAALPALHRPPQLPVAGAGPAGDGMRRVAEEQLSFDDLLAETVVEPSRPARMLDPAEVARRCGLSYAPSPEQARVVAAPADRPLVVVAGAGSGKTETMAARVAWLVANRLVEPEAILGLTFTRKAASELGERVRLRLAALARHPDTDDELRRRLDIAAADRVHLPRVRGLAGRRARPADRRGARRGRARTGDVLGAGGHGGRRVHRRHERRPAHPAHHRRGRPRPGRGTRRARREPGRSSAPGRAGWRRRSRPTPTRRRRRARTRR